MWSQAEKIIAENDRLRGRIEKADTEAVAMRKKYEDQISTIKMESIDKERTNDAVSRSRQQSIQDHSRLSNASVGRALRIWKNHVHRVAEVLSGQTILHRQHSHVRKYKIFCSRAISKLNKERNFVAGFWIEKVIVQWRPINQSINQSMFQSINQSINQCFNRWFSRCRILMRICFAKPVDLKSLLLLIFE